MKSIIRKFGAELPSIIFPIREDGKVAVCPVDAFAGATFNVNEFGHIKNDVSALMEAQSQAEIDLISKRLVEAQGENPDLSGLTDHDIYRYAMSRYCQTPAEVQMFGESLAKAQYDRDQRIAKDAADKAAVKAENERIEAEFKAYREARAAAAVSSPDSSSKSD